MLTVSALRIYEDVEYHSIVKALNDRLHDLMFQAYIRNDADTFRWLHSETSDPNYQQLFSMLINYIEMYTEVLEEVKAYRLSI